MSVSVSESVGGGEPGHVRILLTFFPRNLIGKRCHNQYTDTFFLIVTHSIQVGAAITKHGVTRKRTTTRLQHIGKLFRKNLQLKDVC